MPVLKRRKWVNSRRNQYSKEHITQKGQRFKRGCRKEEEKGTGRGQLFKGLARPIVVDR